MKINSIVNRYVLKEMILPFVINTLFFTFVFLMTKILEITKLIINYRIRLSSVLLMLLYSMPYFLNFVIPMSVMMAVLLTFLRMSGDNEIVALKASGMSIVRLLFPVFIFSLIGVLLTGFMSFYAVTWGRLERKNLITKVAVSHAETGLKARTFNDGFKGMMLYVEKINLKENKLVDVFIEDKRTKNIISTVVAPKGVLYKRPDQFYYHLRLYKGVINQVDIDNMSVHSINFDTYDIDLDYKKSAGNIKEKRKKIKEMNYPQLRNYLKQSREKNERYYKALTRFHSMFSIPFACIALGLLAVPLGIQVKSFKRSFGLGLGLVFFLCYYLMLSAGWVFGKAGLYPPLVGMWVPNLVMGGLGIFLLIKTPN